MNKLIATLALLAVNAYAGYNPNTPELVAKTKPGVVLIQILDSKDQPMGLATGWVARSNAGYELVTNAHVLDGGSSIKLVTLNGVKLNLAEEGEMAEGWDKAADIAMLRLKYDPILPEIALPVSYRTAQEGEHVLVIGNPRGMTGTVSDGMVSANRDGEFQITAPISQGSSGSPVINDEGQVVGMVKAYMNEAQNINMCVSLSNIRLVLDNPSHQDGTSNDHKELTPPTSNTNWDLTDHEMGQISTLVINFTNNLAEGIVERGSFCDAGVSQWYDEKGRRISYGEIVNMTGKDWQSWKKQFTYYYSKKIVIRPIDKHNGYRNFQYDIPFDWTGIDRKNHTVKKSGIMHLAVYESGNHNRWYIEAVCNDGQI